MTSLSIVFALYIFPLPLPSNAEPFLIKSGRWFESALIKLMALIYSAKLIMLCWMGDWKNKMLTNGRYWRKNRRNWGKSRRKNRKVKIIKAQRAAKRARNREMYRKRWNIIICFFWPNDYCITKGWPRKRLRHTMNLGGVH